MLIHIATGALIVSQDSWPVGVAAHNRVGLVRLPQFFRPGIEVQEELAIDDLPLLGIAGRDIALADRPWQSASALSAAGKPA